jgi:hypothetical protein
METFHVCVNFSHMSNFSHMETFHVCENIHPVMYVMFKKYMYQVKDREEDNYEVTQYSRDYSLPVSWKCLDR